MHKRGRPITWMTSFINFEMDLIAAISVAVYSIKKKSSKHQLYNCKYTNYFQYPEWQQILLT